MSLRALVTAGMEDAKIGHKADAMLMRMGLDPLRMSDGLSGRRDAALIFGTRALHQARYPAS
jgi:hypothetical protein